MLLHEYRVAKVFNCSEGVGPFVRVWALRDEADAEGAQDTVTTVHA